MAQQSYAEKIEKLIFYFGDTAAKLKKLNSEALDKKEKAFVNRLLKSAGLAKTSKSAWKNRERKAARVFGADRNSLSGSNSKLTASDSTSAALFIETKLKARWAVFSLFRQTAELAKRESKTPLLMLAQKERPGFLLVCRIDDLQTIAQLQAGVNPLLL